MRGISELLRLPISVMVDNEDLVHLGSAWNNRFFVISLLSVE